MIVAAAASLAAIDVGQAFDAFWRGSFGTASAFFSGTLVRAIPLTIIGTGIAVAFRAGALNIGAEGQLLAGAVAATVVGLHAPGNAAVTVILALAAAAIAGGAWAGVAAMLRARFGVLEVISTIMLNFVAANLVSYLVRGPLQEPTRIYPQTEAVAIGARLPRLSMETRLHAGVFIAIAAAVAAWWVLTRTAAGFRLRAVGASATAARVAGRVDTERVVATALIASGALAGLAGGVEISGVTYALFENLSPGYGFSAIAVAVLARLHPLAVPIAAVLFGGLETGALGMQRDAGIPSVIASVFEAVVILLVIAGGGGALRRLARTPRRAAAVADAAA